MQTNELQKKIIEFVGRWGKVRKSTSSNSKDPKDATFFHIVEEVGELAQQYVNRNSRKDRYDEAEIKDAIGDTTIQLVKLADLYGWNIEEIITEIMEREEVILQEKERAVQ